MSLSKIDSASKPALGESSVHSSWIDGKHLIYYYPDLNLLTLDGVRDRNLAAEGGFRDTLLRFYSGLRRLKVLKEALRLPRTLFVEPWRTCNLACTYCYAHAGPSQGKKIQPDQMHALINRYPFKQILVFGGEPLLDSEFLLSLYHARQWDSFFFSTNGILLNQKAAQCLIGLPRVTFQISLEPSEWSYRVTTKGQHQFGLLVPALRSLCSYRPNLRITIPPDAPHVPLKDLIDRIVEAIGGLQFTISYWPADSATLPPWIESWVRESYELLRDDGDGRYDGKLPCSQVQRYFREAVENGFRLSNCNAGHGSVAVGPDGRLHGCHELAVMESDLDTVSSSAQPLKIGGSRRLNLVYQWANTVNNTPCAACPARYLCGGICFIQKLPNAACLFVQKMLGPALTGMARYSPLEAMRLASRSEEAFDYLFSIRQKLGEEVKSEKWKRLVSGELPLAEAVALAERFLNN